MLRFAQLAESGYYNGLTFHRVVPNFVIQGGSPGANEYVGDAWFMRDELGLWPHVRGAVGISTRGRDTGDAQIFIDLVDNPRLDHEYTVFAQVLNGIEVVDRILEGDVIERSKSCCRKVHVFRADVPARLLDAPTASRRRVAALRADGRAVHRPHRSNPTRAGFAYPADLLAPLGDARGLRLRAARRSALPSAREAVAADYARRGIDVAADRIVLTASTSEAYSLLFKLLADPGDEVLVPRPSYPLFEHLTRLDAVVARAVRSRVSRRVVDRLRQRRARR